MQWGVPSPPRGPNHDPSPPPTNTNPSFPPPPPLHTHPPSDRFLDDFLITLRRKLPTASATGLSTVVAALPSLSSGVRLNEVVADAQARYDALAAAAQQQEAEYAAAAAAGEAAEGYEGYAAQDAAQDPAAPEAVAA